MSRGFLGVPHSGPGSILRIGLAAAAIPDAEGRLRLTDAGSISNSVNYAPRSGRGND